MTAALRYLLGAAAGVIVGTLTWLGLVFGQSGVATPQAAWLAELYGVKQEAVRKARGGNVLLVGGRDVHFGLSAERLGRQIDRRTINFGAHEGVGLAYLLHRVRLIADAGDLIVLQISHGLLTGESEISPLLVDIVLADDTAYLRSAESRWSLRFLANVPIARIVEGYRVRIGLPSQASAPHPRSSVGQLGDDLAREGLSRTAIGPVFRSADDARGSWPPRLSNAAKDQLALLLLWARQRDVKVVAVWSPSPDTAATAAIDWAEFVRDVDRYAKRIGLPLIGDPLSTVPVAVPQGGGARIETPSPIRDRVPVEVRDKLTDRLATVLRTWLKLGPLPAAQRPPPTQAAPAAAQPAPAAQSAPPAAPIPAPARPPGQSAPSTGQPPASPPKAGSPTAATPTVAAPPQAVPSRPPPTPSAPRGTSPQSATPTVAGPTVATPTAVGPTVAAPTVSGPASSPARSQSRQPAERTPTPRP